MEETIAACVLFLISAGLFILSYRSFREKGFLLNNAYIYASEQERERMEKKPYYRQSAIVLLLLGFSFVFNGMALLQGADWLYWLVGISVAITIVYAIVSSIMIVKR